MIRRADPYAYYLAVARIEQGDGLPAKVQPVQFPAIGQAIEWGAERVAHDERVRQVFVYGIDESAGFADQVFLGGVDAHGWVCVVEHDPTRPLG